jgi:endoglucanase
MRNAPLKILASVAVALSPALGCEPAETPAIVMNQLGVPAGLQLKAVLRSTEAKPVRFVVRDGEGRIVIRDRSTVVGKNESSGDHLHLIRSGPLPEGEGYLIEACGARSGSFASHRNGYASLAEAALNYFYANRFGEPILPEHLPGPEWARPAGFPDEVVTCFSGEDTRGQIWPGCAYRLNVTGGWADAGDYGKYVVNGGLTVWTLQNAVERFRYLRSEAWTDGRATLPESGNGVSDILDEARHGLEFLLAMQVPEGERLSVATGAQTLRAEEPLSLKEIDAGGLVHHKVHEKAWLPLPQQVEEVAVERFLYPPSTAATLNLAAAAAQAARLWQGKDDQFASEALSAAKHAYDAAKRHPDILAYDNFTGGGPYGDDELSDEFAWAATELWLTTGEERYKADLGSGDLVRFFSHDFGDLSWASLRPAASLSLALHQDRLSAKETLALRGQFHRTAGRYIADRDREGYRFPMSMDAYVWGSAGNAANRGVILMAAYDLTGERAYLEAGSDALDFLLGRNALGMSYVAGFGARAMETPHHRFWAQGADAAFPKALPGALSGGPNATLGQDPFSTQLDPCAPQRCWADEVEAYSLNEVAINWNAPLFWLAAALDHEIGRGATNDETIQRQ